MTDQPERPEAAGGGVPVPAAAPVAQPAAAVAQPAAPPPAPASQPAQPVAAAQPAPAQAVWGAQSAPAQAAWGAQPPQAAWPAQPPQAAWGAQPPQAAWPAQPPQAAWVAQPRQAGWGTPPGQPPGAWGAPPAGAPPAGGPPGWGTGAAPQPRPRGPRGTSGRTALAVFAIIIGVVFGANIVNAAMPLPEEPTAVDPGPALPQDPGGPTETQAPQPTQEPGGPTETSIPIETLPPLETNAPIETAAPVDPGPVNPGSGVDVGAGFVIFPPDGWSAVGGDNGLTVFQKSGVLLIVGGLPWGGTPSELATQYRDAWFAGGQLNGDEPKAGEIGNGIPAAGLNYSGVIEGTQVDGAIVTGATNGAGILFNFFGASGSLNGVSSDLETILSTVQYTGG